MNTTIKFFLEQSCFASMLGLVHAFSDGVKSFRMIWSVMAQDLNAATDALL